MTDKVLSLLTMLGYSIKEGDDQIVMALVKKVESDIMGFCNLHDMPDGLSNVVLYRTVGEFVSAKKNCGQTEGFVSLNFEPIMSQISEGDTSISYYVKGMRSDERRLNLLVASLVGYGKNQIVKYRRLLW